jgi:hypothetical protein
MPLKSMFWPPLTTEVTMPVKVAGAVREKT